MEIPESEVVSPLEKILKNPGLVHLAENIFDNLCHEDMEVYRDINQSSREIFDNPMFWLRKFGNLSKENQKDWINVIESVDMFVKKKAIISYLQWNLEREALMDLPCYSSPAVQDEFMEKLRDICKKRRMELSDADIEIIKIIVPLIDNPNATDQDGYTLIRYAAIFRHTEIVKILAPLMDNPNSPDNQGNTPIHFAACSGHTHTEIAKIFINLTDNPNAPNNDGETPIYWAAVNGNTEIVKLLAPLTDNPNAPNNDGYTPIHKAAQKGHSEILKILSSLTQSPNAPYNQGNTLPSIVRNVKICRILKSNTSRKRKAVPSTKPSRKQTKKL